VLHKTTGIENQNF